MGGKFCAACLPALTARMSHRPISIVQ
jgi:hypothetical protein